MKLTRVFVLCIGALFMTACGLADYVPGGYALVYGVSDYSLMGVQSLTLTDDDAEDVAAMFESHGYTVLLRIDKTTDRPASLAQLKQDIADVSGSISPRDNFVFYFSGHGGFYEDFLGAPQPTKAVESSDNDDNDEWIFLYGEQNLAALPFDEWDTIALRDDDLKAILAPLPTRKRLVLIDACNSAGFIGSGNDVDAVPKRYILNGEAVSWDLFVEAALTFFKKKSSADTQVSDAIIISAAGEDEYSWEDIVIGNGIFTYHLLDVPNRGDINRDGFITVSEAYTYVSLIINASWNNSSTVGSAGRFHPHMTGGPADFILF